MKEATQKVTRFAEFKDDTHPFSVWWKRHGQYMMSGGGHRESIWAARGWIAREQLACGADVTGDSLHEKCTCGDIYEDYPRPGEVPSKQQLDSTCPIHGSGIN